MADILPVMNLSTAILVVDDDPGIRETIGDYLRSHGFVVGLAGRAQQMREQLAQRDWDLIVLDVMLPDEDGLSLLRQLQRDNGPPVIMLSAMGSDTDRIVGLEIGAEDYLAKPCNPRELVARIRTVLRRQEKARLRQEAAPAPGGAPLLCFAGWTLNRWSRALRDPEDTVVALSDGEYRLLLAFLEHPGRVLTRDQLLEYSRGGDSDSYDRAIDVQISRLRKKLRGAAGEEFVRTVRNEGYMFMPAVGVRGG
ncbi:two-component system, OmpR family, response regulator [Solimonas aquatica]|uniref:Two-component system, OmpR family, response regulator n=1 Tax=Solimonas aquatica TaxID=489703 RepID=A0A1H9GGP1_9GAMM|nr:response regulator transcription factor [Solimonas aquatica]SEQ49280.1 two-component system, OmpR family, response regulator [Solimonas aquatica]